MTVQLFTGAGAGANISASKVVSKQPCKVKRIIITSGAATATIDLFDDTTTTSPQNRLLGTITIPTGGITNPVVIDLDMETNKGLTVLIAVAAANVTFVGNFSN